MALLKNACKHRKLPSEGNGRKGKSTEVSRKKTNGEEKR